MYRQLSLYFFLYILFSLYRNYFELSSYFGKLIVRLFGVENFEKLLRAADIAQMDGMSLVFLFSGQVAGAVSLPILVACIIHQQVVLSIFIFLEIVMLSILAVGDFTNERDVNFAISSLVEFFSSKLFNSWLLVLSLIVFVRSWRKLQATV